MTIKNSWFLKLYKRLTIFLLLDRPNSKYHVKLYLSMFYIKKLTKKNNLTMV